jgi:cation diffusion facilitator CzcD-associated flavoprotein CzcO
MEHVDVLIVGAGLSGVGAAAQVRERLPHKTVAVFESRDAKGGTWDLFRYPGIRSDSDMFTFGYTWRPWNSDIALADGPLIREYIDTVATEYDVERLIRYGHRITRAEWDSTQDVWTVTAQVGEPDSGETVTLTANILWSCAGYYKYDEGFQPTWPGMEHFRGPIIHPQHWPEDLDYTGKRVVVVGSGATAVTLVPSMAPDAEHVTMVQRTPTYVLNRARRDPVARFLTKLRLPERLVYRLTRWANILQAVGFYKFSIRWPEQAKKFIRRETARQLPADFDLSHFTAPYNPWEQRLCFVPNGDLFRAIRNGQASVVTDTIAEFTPDGLKLSSGGELPADIVVTATGFQMQLPFGGIDYLVDGKPMDMPSRMAYKGMMLSDVPNLFFTLGYTNASWTLKADLVIDFVCRVLAHMDATGQKVVRAALDPTMTGKRAFPLNSGYVQRSAHLLPLEGEHRPWKLDQNYLVDQRVIRKGALNDGVLAFS